MPQVVGLLACAAVGTVDGLWTLEESYDPAEGQCQQSLADHNFAGTSAWEWEAEPYEGLAWSFSSTAVLELQGDSAVIHGLIGTFIGTPNDDGWTFWAYHALASESRYEEGDYWVAEVVTEVEWERIDLEVNDGDIEASGAMGEDEILWMSEPDLWDAENGSSHLGAPTVIDEENVHNTSEASECESDCFIELETRCEMPKHVTVTPA